MSDPRSNVFQQFSFEDGTLLRDYPASVDLEVSEDGSDTHTVRSIYNSQILQTVPSSEATSSSVEKGDNLLKPTTIYTSTAPVRPSGLSYSRARDAVQSGMATPDQVIETERESTSSRVLTPYPKLMITDTAVAEAQEVLHRSLADLLEIAETLEEDPCDNEISTQQTM